MSTSQHQDADAPVVEVTSEPEPEVSNDPDEIREQIEQTRAELGETVEALAAKVDVKAQAKDKLEEVKAQAKEKATDVKDQLKEKQEEVTSKVVAVRDQAVNAAPEPALGALRTVKEQVRKPPVLAAVAGVLIGLIVWRMKRAGD